MWRQGDIFIQTVEAIPPRLTKQKRLILAAGDSTGQRHQIKQRRAAELFQGPGDDLYLAVVEDEATVVHPEHAPITLPKGNYRIWHQREFADAASRRVAD